MPVSERGPAQRKVTVILAFECDVEGEVEPNTVGQNLCQLIETPGHIGNPNWLATPRAVGFIRATENGCQSAG